MKYTIMILVILAMLGCSFNEMPSGTIAKVNGQYITLKELRDRYDVQTMHISEVVFPTIEEIHKEYTETLSDMILEIVLEQELAKHNIEVSEREVNDAIEEIKSEYSADEFSQMLAERYIEAESWKQQIRASLIEQSFMKHIVAPKVKIEAKEIEEFYEEHKAYFIEQAKFSGIILSSKNKKEIILATKALQNKESIATVKKEYPAVHIENITTELNSLPLNFIKEIQNMRLGSATTLHTVEKNEYMIIIVNNRTSKRQLLLRESLLLVEEQLVAKKSRGLYKSEAEKLLESSSVQIATEFKDYIDELITKNVPKKK